MKKILVSLLCVALLCSCFATGYAANKISMTWLIHFEEEGMQGWARQLAEEFNALHPEAEVLIEFTSASNYDQIVKTKIASDDAPMFFDMSNGRSGLAEYQVAGHLADLSDLECLANIDATIRPEGQLNGVQYAVPYDRLASCVFYNKAIFSELNLEVPTTWDAFIAVCEAVKKAGYTPISSAYGERWCISVAASIFYTPAINPGENPTWWTDKMTRTAKFADDEVFKDAFEKLMVLCDYSEADPFGTSATDTYYNLANGKCAMVLNGSWVLDGCNSLNPDCDLGAFPIPLSNTETARMLTSSGSLFCMYNTTDEETLKYAKMFYNYVYSKESGQYYATIARRMTAVDGVDLSEFPTLTFLINYPAKVSTIGLNTFTAEFTSLYLDAVSDALLSYMGTHDAKTVVANMCATLDKGFDDIAK